MPTTKLTSGGNPDIMLRYLLKNNQDGTRVRAIGGSVIAEDWKGMAAEFAVPRGQYSVTEGVLYHQGSLSFDPGNMGSLWKEDGSPDYGRLVAFGEAWAQKTGIAQKHQFAVVVHGDKPHPHVHVCWNAVSHVNGNKWHSDRAFLERARDATDSLARDYGIANLPNRDRNTARPPDRVLRAAERGAGTYSWKLDLRDRVATAARRSISEEDFRRNLSRSGVEVRRRGEGYSYSFKDDTGHKRIARSSRLGEEYRPAALQERFVRQRNLLLSDPQAAAQLARQMKEEQGRPLTSWRQELRQCIHEAASRARSLEDYTAKLACHGIEVKREGHSLSYTISGPEGQKHVMTDRELGAAHTEPRLLSRLAENDFRRRCRLDVVTALRGARTEQQFASRLAERGVGLERDPAGRFLYQFRRDGLTPQKINGESLTPYLSTGHVERRLNGRDGNEAPALTPALLTTTSRQASNLARTLSAEISRDSHAGYHEEHAPAHSDRWKRKQRLEEERGRF
jgi:hypothetical protein